MLKIIRPDGELKLTKRYFDLWSRNNDYRQKAKISTTFTYYQTVCGNGITTTREVTGRREAIAS